MLRFRSLRPLQKSRSLCVGKSPEEAVYHAVVLEEVAKMAARTERLNPSVEPAPKILQDKHYLRKHGKNAYYGQIAGASKK